MRRFKIRKIFSSLLCSYAAILFLPLCLLIILMIYSENQAENKSINELENALEQSVRVFQSDLEECRTGAAALAYDPMLRVLMKKENIEDADQEVEKIAQYNDKLNDLFAKSAFYHDYAVILKNGFAFRSNSVSVGKKFFYDHYRKYEKCSFEEWEKISFYSLGAEYIPLQSIVVNGLKEESLTLVFPIRNVSDVDSQADASVQFLIYERQLKEQFAQVLEKNPEISVFVLSSEGKSLLCLTLESVISEGMVEQVSFEGEKGSSAIKWHGEKQLVIYRQESETGLLFVAAIPFRVATESARELRVVSILLFLIFLTIELGIGVFFAVRYSTPVRNIMANIARVFETDTTEGLQNLKKMDEYAYLSEGVNRLILDNRKINHYNFMLLLCSGEFKSEESVLAEGRRSGVILEARRYLIGVTILKNSESVERMAMVEPQGFAVCYFIQGRGKLTVLFGVKDQTKEEAECSILKYKQGIDTITGENTIWGIGKEYESLTEVFLSYRQAVSCLEQEKETSAGIRYYMKTAGEKAYFWYPPEMEDGIVNAAKYGERTALKNIFEKIRRENCDKRHLDGEIGELLLSRLIDTFCNICNNVVADRGIEDVIIVLRSKDTLAQRLDLLCEKYMELCEGQADFKNKHDETFYQQLVQYIEENYQDSQLSLAMAAEKFSLSENYFSQFFKNIVGEPFSNYLEKVRTANAKKLLEKKRYDMEEIAATVGYNNSASFRRAFKKNVGVSPSVWKRENGISM